MSHTVCVENGLLFHPIAFESTEDVASESLVTLKAFCRRICSSTTADPKKSFRKLMKKISMALQKAYPMFVIDRLSLARSRSCSYCAAMFSPSKNVEGIDVTPGTLTPRWTQGQSFPMSMNVVVNFSFLVCWTW